MPGTVLKILWTFAFLNFSTALRGRDNYVYCKMGNPTLNQRQVTEEFHTVSLVWLQENGVLH